MLPAWSIGTPPVRAPLSIHVSLHTIPKFVDMSGLDRCGVGHQWRIGVGDSGKAKRRSRLIERCSELGEMYGADHEAAGKPWIGERERCQARGHTHGIH